MVEICVLALALSMDAFAVSIGLGARKVQHPVQLALLAALYFGGFQGFMPLLGYVGGTGLKMWIGDYMAWCACGLLVFIGGKMLLESFSHDAEAIERDVTQRLLVVLAIATSVDALAAGLALHVLSVSPWWACGIIAVIAAVCSALGVLIGQRCGERFGQGAEAVGGLVLIGIGIKMVIV